MPVITETTKQQSSSLGDNYFDETCVEEEYLGEPKSALLPDSTK